MPLGFPFQPYHIGNRETHLLSHRELFITKVLTWCSNCIIFFCTVSILMFMIGFGRDWFSYYRQRFEFLLLLLLQLLLMRFSSEWWFLSMVVLSLLLLLLRRLRSCSKACSNVHCCSCSNSNCDLYFWRVCNCWNLLFSIRFEFWRVVVASRFSIGWANPNASIDVLQTWQDCGMSLRGIYVLPPHRQSSLQPQQRQWRRGRNILFVLRFCSRCCCFILGW